jgi:hypothetical protein
VHEHGTEREKGPCGAFLAGGSGEDDRHSANNPEGVFNWLRLAYKRRFEGMEDYPKDLSAFDERFAAEEACRDYFKLSGLIAKE